MCGGGRTGPDVQIIGWRGEVELTDLTICTDDIGFSDCYLLRPVAPEMVPGIMMAARMTSDRGSWIRIAYHFWRLLDEGEVSDLIGVR